MSSNKQIYVNGRLFLSRDDSIYVCILKAVICRTRIFLVSFNLA